MFHHFEEEALADASCKKQEISLLLLLFYKNKQELIARFGFINIDSFLLVTLTTSLEHQTRHFTYYRDVYNFARRSFPPLGDIYFTRHAARRSTLTGDVIYKSEPLVRR
mgnify:CR=1 FL=1